MGRRSRRLLRIVLNAATVVSLVLCVAILTCNRCFRPTLHWTICFSDGDLRVGHNGPLPSKPKYLPGEVFAAMNETEHRFLGLRVIVGEATFLPTEPIWPYLPHDDPASKLPVVRRNYDVPGGAIYGCALLLILPTARGTWWMWRRRHGRGRVDHALCPACGYDLRATLDRCPECGAVPTAAPP